MSTTYPLYYGQIFYMTTNPPTNTQWIAGTAGGCSDGYPSPGISTSNSDELAFYDENGQVPVDENGSALQVSYGDQVCIGNPVTNELWSLSGDFKGSGNCPTVGGKTGGGIFKITSTASSGGMVAGIKSSGVTTGAANSFFIQTPAGKYLQASYINPIKPNPHLTYTSKASDATSFQVFLQQVPPSPTEPLTPDVPSGGSGGGGGGSGGGGSTSLGLYYYIAGGIVGALGLMAAIYGVASKKVYMALVGIIMGVISSVLVLIGSGKLAIPSSLF
jgi:hypothetical protein